MLEVVIFSKDRPCQLDMLLRSIKQHFQDWRESRIAVLYTYSSWPLRYSYDLVRAEHSEFEFLCERDTVANFKQATLSLLGARPMLAFMVDDDVFKAPFSVNAPEVQIFRADPRIMCVSLRMDPGMDYVYTQDQRVQIPPVSREGIWDWTKSEGDWAYPMSLDGHIFRSSEILPLLESIDFHNPNSLEFALAKRPLANPLAVCFETARIINIPLNRVQDTAPNRHLGEAARSLNIRFLSGERPALSSVSEVRARSPHHEVPLQWEGWKSAPRWVIGAARTDAGVAALHARWKQGRLVLRRVMAKALKRSESGVCR